MRPHLLVLLGAFAFSTLDIAQARPMTIEDLWQMQTVTGMQVAPDGKRVAYTLSVQRDPFEDSDGPAYSHLYVFDGDGSSRAYISGKATVQNIRWRPGHNSVSFLAKNDLVADGEDNFLRLREIPVAGGEARDLFSHHADIADYRWVDGDTLLFLATSGTPESRKTAQKKGFDAIVYEEDWLTTHVWRVDLSAPNPEAEKLDHEGSARALELAADGSLAGVRIAETPSIDDNYMRSKIHIFALPDWSRQTVIETAGKVGGFAFAPDGRHVALHAGVDKNDPSPGVLMVADTSEGTLRMIGAEATETVEGVGWLDRDTILATVAQREGYVLRGVPVSEEGVSRELAAFDDLAVTQAATTTDGVVVQGSRPDQPPTLFRVNNLKATQIIEHNVWLEDVDLGTQEVFAFAARDGLDVSGVLIKPTGFERGARYPLIMSVHGGPEAHRSNGWLTYYNSLAQIFAGQGYAVYFPNYRGSTGRGVKFTKLHQNDYAGGEFNDLVDAVGALSEAGIVDKDKVGITGGSYGGYATNWAATALSEHFAAGVSLVGISNQISKFGTTDIPNEMYLVHSRAWPWEKWDEMLERSPIYHAAKQQTPLLIAHGKLDPRVHPSQSLELYRYLERRGQAPVRLVWYPQEQHGNRNAAARLDFAMRLERWMNHYLKGPGGEPPAHELDLADRLQSGDES